ncbi:hypothetical protein SAY87_022589 [Trapa incisa]|uniref:Uncharacterized protein n=1 Tax=Trapa incisa TaxID=236973 RepID=A0AAN7K822_9MYRT|nr:hypothetical protein SAY87_022589 [Trapa incisa]
MRGHDRSSTRQSVISFLYPPRPSQVEEEEDWKSFSQAEVKEDWFPDDLGDSDSSSKSESDGEIEGGNWKLTRAQRKRIRKKKLWEESDKMIGPLLPSVVQDEYADVQKDETKDARRNAQEDNASSENQLDAAASTKQRSLKHRRMVKRLAKDGLASSIQTKDE